MDIWCRPLPDDTSSSIPRLFFISDFVTRYPAGSEVLKLYHNSTKDSVCFHCCRII